MDMAYGRHTTYVDILVGVGFDGLPPAREPTMAGGALFQRGGGAPFGEGRAGGAKPVRGTLQCWHGPAASPPQLQAHCAGTLNTLHKP